MCQIFCICTPANTKVLPVTFGRKGLYYFLCGLATQMPMDCQPSATITERQPALSVASRNQRPPLVDPLLAVTSSGDTLSEQQTK